MARALQGSVSEHQRKMLAHQLRHFECVSQEITALDEDVKKPNNVESQITLLDEIPGIDRRRAERILAETGVHMDQFPSTVHLCSWEGLTQAAMKAQVNESPFVYEKAMFSSKR